MKPILEALNEDGSISMELLKGISRGCLAGLKERQAQKKFLGHIRPALVFYGDVGGKIEIEFGARKIEPTELTDSLSKIQWMAPELFQKDSKPSADSDIFTLGLLFHFMLTKGGNPMAITSTFFKNEISHDYKINLKLLDSLTKDTDTILFIDLIKRMIEKVPDQRQTCESLIHHAALKTNKGRLEIVQHLAGKCFDGDKCINEYLVKVMDKKEVHMEGALGEDSAEWKKLLAETSKLPDSPDIKKCSSLLKIFTKQSRNILLQPIMTALPNFFPHLYNIYREELPKIEQRPFREIFEHYNDRETSLGTGSNHTRVYKGMFQRRPIAIKRVVRDLAKIVDREISIMLQTDRHPNILKYFAKEETEDFIYIGTELCEANLATFIRNRSLRQKMATKTIFQQTAEGLNHLHHLSIIHRDVKPENILICNDNGTYSIKLADFGISKDLNATTLSTLHSPGTVAWIAPEVDDKGHTKSSDVFSLGSVFYFVTSNGIILSKESGRNYQDLDENLKRKLQELNDQGNNEQFLQIDLLARMLNLKPDLRPSAKKVLHHPIFWADKKSLEFILKIRRKFDVLDPKFASKIKYGMEHQKVLMETPIVQRLKVALDVDKSVVKSDWKAKLDKTLAEEFKGGYDKESVSDLLRAMRNKWMHKEELNDTIKALFGDFTEGEYLNYFTSRYPRLLVHCYNAVEKEARELLSEFFHQSKNELSAKAVDTPGFNFEGSKLIINCQDITTFPETNVLFDSVEIFGITHLFIEQNKSFTNFFHKNGSTVTQLEFFYGSLKFDSVNKILQKLPNLKKLKFDDVEYEAPKMNQTIPPSTCQNLVELLIWSLKRSNLFQAFQECPTIQKLTVWFPEVTLEGILQKFSSLEELTVDLNDKYPVTPTVTSKNHQLKVLQIKLDTRDEKIQQKLFAFIQKQSHLQKFSFVSKNYSPSQSLCKQLSAHICQLQHLTSLEINDIVLLGEVEAFVANSPTANSRLLALVWQLEPIKSPSTFFGHFTNLKQLDIGCTWVDDSKIYKNLVSFMNATKLTSITLRWLPPACFQCFKQLEVHSLQFLDILVDNESQDKVPAFEILQEVLKKHPNITDFKIQFDNDYDEQKSLELIPMIVGLSSKLERLVIVNYSKITPEVINQIAALKVLKWQINEHKSETFYKTFWKNLKLSMLLNPPAISSRYSYPMGTIRELPR